MSAFIRFIIFASLSLILINCSIYETGGRKAIEDNQGGIVVLRGHSDDLSMYYECSITSYMPHFLKTELYVLSSKYEPFGYSVFATHLNQPQSVYVYLHNEQANTYTHCHVHNLRKNVQPSEILIELGHNKVQELFPRP